MVGHILISVGFVSFMSGRTKICASSLFVYFCFLLVVLALNLEDMDFLAYLIFAKI